MSTSTIEDRHQQDLQNASRYAFLFPALALLLITNPFLEGDSIGKLLTQLSFLVVVLGSIIAIRRQRVLFITALVCAAPAVATPEWGLVEPTELTRVIPIASYILVVGICVVSITIDVYKATMVTFGTLLGVCSVYLLIGVLFALMYSLAFVVDPQAFNGLTERNETIYFSFVTLTTLGYGDMAPVNNPVRVLAALEAVIGQLFVAIMVARLVALQTARVSSDLK